MKYLGTLRTYDVYKQAERIGAVSARNAKEAVDNACSKYGLKPRKDAVTVELR